MKKAPSPRYLVRFYDPVGDGSPVAPPGPMCAFLRSAVALAATASRLEQRDVEVYDTRDKRMAALFSAGVLQMATEQGWCVADLEGLPVDAGGSLV